jgi:RNA polymerase sigma-70 factor (ECF subfamily)
MESKPPEGSFPATQWSVVLAAGGGENPPAARALDSLCRAYWVPLYAFVRRSGYAPADAEDLTQQFFARLLAGEGLRTADPSRGRFRTFLLTSLQRFLVSEWRRGQALKRGESQLIRVDPARAEELIGLSSTGRSPETEYDRQWADQVLRQALTRLSEEYTADGKARLYEQLRGQVWGAAETTDRTDLAAELGLTEGAVRVAVHRLRRRFRELLRAEVAATVAREGDVDDELRYLAGLLVA